MAPHSRTLAWKISWMEEPGRLKSMGSLRVGHDWATLLSRIGEGNGNPLQCSCLENPRDRGAWWAAVYGVAQSRTWLKRLSSSSILFGDHCASWTYVYMSFGKFGNNFIALSYFSYPGIPVTEIPDLWLWFHGSFRTVYSVCVLSIHHIGSFLLFCLPGHWFLSSVFSILPLSSSIEFSILAFV